uniref:Uncharacterized protein n=1 Tax=Acrobeloides nanus TaxID=290746 RepID=A0A914D2H2_9BILA
MPILKNLRTQIKKKDLSAVVSNSLELEEIKTASFTSHKSTECGYSFRKRKIVDIKPDTVEVQSIDPSLLEALKRPIVVIEPIDPVLLQLAQESKPWDLEEENIPKFEVKEIEKTERASSVQSTLTYISIFSDYSDDVPSEFSFECETPPPMNYCKVQIGHKHAGQWPKRRLLLQVNLKKKTHSIKSTKKPYEKPQWDDGSVQPWFFINRK